MSDQKVDQNVLPYESWGDRARKARKRAAEMPDGQAKRSILQIASEYDSMAERAKLRVPAKKRPPAR